MDEKKILTAAEINKEMITTCYAPWSEAVEEAKSAIQAYWDDFERRKAEIEKQAQGYKKQIDALTVQRKKLAAQINNLSSRGQIDAAATADAKLEAIDRSISSLQRKVRIINTAEMRGDTDLYHAAKKAYQAVIDQGEACRKHMRELSAIAAAEKARLDQIIVTASNISRYRNDTQPVQSRFEEMDHHYHKEV